MKINKVLTNCHYVTTISILYGFTLVIAKLFGGVEAIAYFLGVIVASIFAYQT